MDNEEKKELATIAYESQMKASRDFAEEQKQEAMLTNYQFEIFDRKMAALHKAEKKPAKAIEPFHKYFVERYKKTLPDLCKTVFDERHSPKDYAIMICLIKEKFLLSFTPTHLYQSWYNFIGRKLEENYNAISNNYVERVVGEFDTFDLDYVNLKSSFEKALKANNIK